MYILIDFYGRKTSFPATIEYSRCISLSTPVKEQDLDEHGRNDSSRARQSHRVVDPMCIPPAGLREQHSDKYWNSTHTELTSHLDLHLTKQDLMLSLPACSVFKGPNTPNEEPREPKNYSYGWIERKSSTASPHDPPNSQPWVSQQAMGSDLPCHALAVEVNRSCSCFPTGRVEFKRH